MSDEENLSRRKLLLTTGGIGGSALVPAVAAGEPRDETDLPTEAEVRKSLAAMDVVPKTQPTDSRGGVGMESAARLDDAEVYVGKHRNARPPKGKPFAVENYEEYLARDAPPGFPAHYFDDQAAGTDGVSTYDLPSFYLKEDFGTISLAGHSFSVGFGVGVRLKSSLSGVSAELSVDLYVGGASFAISSFGVGYNVTDKGICLSDFKTSYYILDLEFDICPVISFSGSTFTIGGTVKVCADPCEIIKCPVCKKLGISLSQEVDI